MSGNRSRPSTEAPAKVNWTLEALGRRPDGYHELRSVMQALSLADTLSIEDAGALELAVEGPIAADVPVSENLVLKAAQLFPNLLAERPLRFRLLKRIPAAAGLGGGSSDAAAALRLLRAWWGCADARAFEAAAPRLGSDVAFFLRGGIQRAAGRGEVLTPLPDPPTMHLVVLTPPISVSRKTAELFSRLTQAHYTDGARTEQLAEKVRRGLAPSAADYFNVFDGVADEVFPRLGFYRSALAVAAGSPALLAGAGPSLFAVCRGAEDAAAVVEKLARDHGPAARAACTVPAL